MPTLLNLFGAEYDSRLIAGRDVFSDIEPFVVYNSGSFITKEGRYSKLTNIFTPNENVTIDKDYVAEYSEKARNLILFSAYIVEENYYNYVFTNKNVSDELKQNMKSYDIDVLVSLDSYNQIKDNLKILDWFGDMQIPSNQLSNEFSIKLKDSYMSETLNMFDQRSTNEGFLYLLFYLTLVISDETPQFFAIENIDTAFNPKLCREVVRRLIELARKHDKQIIATTHNPAVLDGLDLHEEEQKLMVVQRSVDGYTKVRTLNNKDIVKSDLPLSQLWLRGFIGGLPNNF